MKTKIFCLSLSFCLTLLNISHAGDFPRCEELITEHFRNQTSVNETLINDKDLSLCRTACEANDVYGCLVLLMNDLANELEPDAKLEARICVLSNSDFPEKEFMGNICQSAAFDYSIHYKASNHDLGLVRTCYEKACNTFDNGYSCALMGELEEMSLNKDLAKQYYEKACNLDTVLGCYELGKKYFSSDKQLAKKYLEKSCAKKHPTGCLLLEELNRQ